MPRSGQRDLKLERRWRLLIGQWERSQQSVHEFCANHHITQASFYAWRREIALRNRERIDAASAPTDAFVPVRVIPDAPIEVVLPSGVVVRVPVGGDPATIARLVAALGATA
jgi:hypothetical protein